MVVLNQGPFSSAKDTMVVSGKGFGCHNEQEGKVGLLASRGRESEMLANVLTLHRMAPTTKNHLARNVKGALI